MATIKLLNNVEQGVPSGNYDGSSQAFYADAEPGNSYYYGYEPVTTVEIRVENFYGRITIQGTLGSIPLESAFVDLATFDAEDSTLQTFTQSQEIIGEYTFLRAYVEEFQSGIIHYVTAESVIRWDY